MNLPNKIAWDDNVLPFQLDDADVRGRVVRLDAVLEKILAQHNYPPAAEKLVAEAAILTALIGQTIELGWKLSLQIRGDGPMRMIATDYFSPDKPGSAAQIRAYASFDYARLAVASDDPFSLIGDGLFAILIDQGPGSIPYQGITPLVGGSLAACAETYFAQSEQIPTGFSIAMEQAQENSGATRWRGGGLMVQHMPKASPLAAETVDKDAVTSQPGSLLQDPNENWSRVNYHLDTVQGPELLGPEVAATDLIHRLFHQETPRVFESQPINFGCTCGPEKVVQSMLIYSAKEIHEMTDDQGRVTADCQFCGAHYDFDPETLGSEPQHS